MPEINVNQETVWLQANKDFGSMGETCPEKLENQGKALRVLAEYTAATQLVKMLTAGGDLLTDLDKTTPEPVHRTNGLITTNNDLILHVNLADCEGIAVNGFSPKAEKEVIGLLHGSCAIVGAGDHLRSLEYLADTYEVEPEDLTVRLAPAAHHESYKFPQAHHEYKEGPGWQDYTYQDDEGLWHINFHQRAIDDLVRFGIPTENITDSPIDTIANPNYFSHYKTAELGEPLGFNGLFLAKR